MQTLILRKYNHNFISQDFPLLVTSQIMIPIINTTIKIPTHTPALKIPPITEQLSRKNASMTIRKGNNCFMFLISRLKNRASRKQSVNHGLTGV